MFLNGNGVTYLWRRNPIVVLWWSAAFPGFGQILLNQYLRGILLTLSEVVTNLLGHVNEAMVYTFCGRFDLAKATLDPRWMYGYLGIYLYAMWSSYRSTITLNRLSHLAELENAQMNCMAIRSMEIQYLERKNPFMGAFWSMVLPGLGQLYNQRVLIGVYAIVWWWIKATNAHLYDSLFLLLTGHLQESIALLNPQWLLYLPSILAGSMYFGYVAAREQNHLFLNEQKQFFANRYRGVNVHIFLPKGLEQC